MVSRRRQVELRPNLSSFLSSGFPPLAPVFRRSPAPTMPLCRSILLVAAWAIFSVAIHSHPASFQLVMDEWRIVIPQLFSHFPPFPPSFQHTFHLLCSAFPLSPTRVVRQSGEKPDGNRCVSPPASAVAGCSLTVLRAPPPSAGRWRSPDGTSLHLHTGSSRCGADGE